MKTKKLSFRQFLKDGIRDHSFGDSPEMDFAEDFIGDSRNAGYEFKAWLILKSHLLVHGACREAVWAAHDLFKKWKQIRKAKK